MAWSAVRIVFATAELYPVVSAGIRVTVEEDATRFALTDYGVAFIEKGMLAGTSI